MVYPIAASADFTLIKLEWGRFCLGVVGMDQETRERFERIEAILAETAQGQAENRVAISQLTQALEKTRQAIVETNRNAIANKAELSAHAEDENAHSS